MAVIPTSGTNIRIIRDVPFHSDYRHTRWFTNRTSQLNYFMSKPVVHTMAEAPFQRDKGNTFLRVNTSLEKLRGANYLIFQNTDYENKWFFAFVTKLEYVQRGTTYVHFQLDVLQTWMFDFTFKPSFIAREHQRLWDDDGKPVINTINEGLDYGTDYDIVDVRHVDPFHGYRFLVIVTKEVIHEGSEGVKPVIIGSPQPLSYYIVPFKFDGSTPNIKVGSDSYAVSPPDRVLEALYQIERAVNNVVSIYVTEYFGVPLTVIPGTNTPDHIEFHSGDFSSVLIGGLDQPFYCIYVNRIDQFEKYTFSIGYGKYLGLRETRESKLWMYPYTVTVLDDLKGNRVELKNEYIENDFIEISLYGSLGPTNKTAWVVENYNHEMNDQIAAEFEYALINNNPQDMPVINDYLTAFLQGNKNSLQTQKEHIFWNSIMSMTSNAISGTASAFAGNLFGAGMAGTSIVQGAVGGYYQIQQLESKVKDIANIPPSLVKMGSNTSFEFGNGLTGLYLIRKQIKPEYQRKLEDFFNMYGYKQHEVKIPNLTTRRYWNYVQTVGCNIRGDFNQEDLTEIKRIFDNGITLWHTDDIGNYNLNNEVIQ